VRRVASARRECRLAEGARCRWVHAHSEPDRADVNAKERRRDFSHRSAEWLRGAAVASRHLVRRAARSRAGQRAHGRARATVRTARGRHGRWSHMATIACGSFLRSICGYHVRGIRRKKSREKMARPRSSDDRVSSSHSGGSAPATPGTSTTASSGRSGASAGARRGAAPATLTLRSCCMARRPDACPGARARSPGSAPGSRAAGAKAAALPTQHARITAARPHRMFYVR